MRLHLLCVFVWLLTAAGALASVQGDLRVVLPGGLDMLQGEWSFSLPGQPAQPGVKGLRLQASVKDMAVDLPQASCRLDAMAVLRLENNATVIESLHGQVRDLRISGIPKPIRSVRFRAAGSYAQHSGALQLQDLQLQVNKALEAQGSLDMDQAGGVRSRLQGRIVDASRLPLVSGLAGQASFRLDLSHGGDNATRANVALLPERLVYAAAGVNAMAAAGVLDAAILLDNGALQSWSVSGNATLKHLTAPGMQADLAGNLELHAAGNAHSAQVDRLALAPSHDALAGELLSFAGHVSLPPGGGPEVRNGLVELGSAGSIAVDARLDMVAPSAHVRSQGLEMAGLAKLVDALLGTGFSQWSPHGTLTLDAATGEAPLQPKGTLQLAEAGFSSQDGNILVDGLALQVRLQQADRATPGGVSLELTVDQGDVLWDVLYASLSQHPVTLQITGTPDLAEQDINTMEITADFAGFGQAHIAGEAGLHAGRVRFTLPAMDLAPVFATFVQEPFSLTNPVLSSMSVNGELSVDMDLGYGVGDSITGMANGRVRLQNGSVLLEGDTPLRIQGIEVDLPAAYLLPGPEAPAGPPQDWGAVSIASLQALYVQAEDLHLDAVMVPNRLYLGKLGGSGLALPVLGGQVLLQDATLDNPFLASARAAVWMQLQDIDLSLLSPGGIPLQGEIGGDLGLVRATRKDIFLPGSLQGTFFGGEVNVDSLRVERPLEPARSLFAEARLRSMQLQPLSEALGVGRINGLLSADMENFQLAYGQPVSLQMQAWSEEKTPDGEDVDQTISLKAVNSISVMGTGQGLTGAGVGLFASFFKEFSYKSIGFSCILINDVFQVRGLIREGGVEYLIKKPPLFGINVINSNPNNRINFSDMLDRIKRVVAPKGAQIGDPQ